MNKAHSLFILGSGRSGTSMTAGLFHESGLFMGGNLHAPSEENPKGYFESAPINQTNNQIIGAHIPESQAIDGVHYRQDSPGEKNGWLARIPLSTDITATPAQSARIQNFVETRPFCLKDPRFCYLLPLWRSHAPEARMICVFREPEVTVESMLKCIHTRPGLSSMALSVDQAFEVWTLMYSHVLRKHANDGKWLFLQYKDILSGEALDAIEDFTEIKIDRQFPHASLQRTTSSRLVPQKAQDVFIELKARAAKSF